MKVSTLDKGYATQWQLRWNALQTARSGNDYAIAMLCHELRQEFPHGDRGDAQFSEWVKKHLRNVARPTSLLRYAEAALVFDERAWSRLGGWPGISFLMRVKSLKQRYRVIDTLHGPGPFHYSTIRKRARALGVEVTRPIGRDTRAEVETRADVLRRYIAELHRTHPELGPLPPNVREAMTPQMLGMLGLPGEARS